MEKQRRVEKYAFELVFCDCLFCEFPEKSGVKLIGKLKEDAATLATALVDLTDDYIVIDNTVFTPASRVISTDGGTIEFDRASYENGIITLE